MSLSPDSHIVSPSDDAKHDQPNDSGGHDDGDDDEDAATEPPRSRFTGSPRTYFRNNQEEHALAESLDRLESNDLSIHLYNVHHLKRRLCSKSEEARNVKPYFRKQRSWSATHKTDWKPSKGWTAWPLKTDDVPRVGKHYGHALEDEAKGFIDASLRRPSKKPSYALEDALLSGILKQARHSFRSQVEKDVGSGSGGRTLSDRDGLRPVIMDDEGKARQLAQPVVRHLISKLEGLLAALHESRKGARRSELSDSDDGHSSGAESSRSQSKSKKRSGSRKADAKGKRTLRQPKPRDWSEVLSVAALIGWDSDAVRRTSARCAALFDESMDLIELDTRGLRMIKSGSAAATGPESASEDSRPVISSTGFTIDDLRCPHTTCERHSKPYDVRWRLNEHMRRTHRDDSTSYRGGYKKRQTPPLQDDEDEAEDMVGGVHVDGFLQPISLNRRPRSRMSSTAGTQDEDSETSRKVRSLDSQNKVDVERRGPAGHVSSSTTDSSENDFSDAESEAHAAITSRDESMMSTDDD